jgi:hypothetical protein
MTLAYIESGDGSMIVTLLTAVPGVVIVAAVVWLVARRVR